MTDPHHDRRWLILAVIATVLASTGLFALVFGMARADSEGWGDPVTLAFLGGAAALLTAFVALERRVAHPLLPLRVVTDRNRGGAFLAIATAGAGIFGLFLFLTFYLQNTKGMTALAFLPTNLSIIFTATLVITKVLARTGPRPLIPTGMLLAALGMVPLTRIGVDSTYAADVLPSLILIGLGFGLIVAPSFATATLGVPRHDSGVASAMLNTSRQVGGSIGTALLSTLAVAATTDFAALHGPGPQAAVEGYVTAFWWAGAIFAAGAVLTGALLRSRVRIPAHGAAEPVAA